MIRVDQLQITENELNDWIDTLRKTYPEQSFGIIGMKKRSSGRREQYICVGREDVCLYLLTPIKERPYYSKIVANLLAGKTNDKS